MCCRVWAWFLGALSAFIGLMFLLLAISGCLYVRSRNPENILPAASATITIMSVFALLPWQFVSALPNKGGKLGETLRACGARMTLGVLLLLFATLYCYALLHPEIAPWAVGSLADHLFLDLLGAFCLLMGSMIFSTGLLPFMHLLTQVAVLGDGDYVPLWPLSSELCDRVGEK